MLQKTLTHVILITGMAIASITLPAQTADSLTRILQQPQLTPTDRVATLMLLSDYEQQHDNLAKAEGHLLSVLTILRADSAGHSLALLELRYKLTGINEKQEDYTQALYHYKIYQAAFEKKYEADRGTITRDLEARYHSQKKEAQLKALQQTAALKSKLNYLYIFLTAIALLAAFWFVRSAIFKVRSSHNHQKLLEKEKEEAELLAQLKQQENSHLTFAKQEAELQARIKEEEAGRLLAERKLLQAQQERLKRDLLTESLQVEQKDKLLQELQKKIEANPNGPTVLRQLNNIIDQSRKIDENLTSYKADHDALHPEFIDKLKEKSGNSLSRLDLKHCSYISLGLSNKEVAERLGVAPKSILMSRYRIKQKLGLGKEEELDDFIQGLNKA